jgi:hypothetical protein
MEREEVFGVLVLVLCGTALLVGGGLPFRREEPVDGHRAERLWWRHIWLPLLPAGLLCALLVGWVLQEPRYSDELVRRVMLVLSLPFAGIFLRGLARAARALGRRVEAPAATVGFFRPRPVLSPGLVAALDGPALAAAHAHEAAHARHRDPLRIWLAQLAADLQWPWPGAQERFHAWLAALELARDDEARLLGADGADLAAAILTAARMGSPSRRPAAVLTGGPAESLRRRVGRLMRPLPSSVPAAVSRPWMTGVVVMALAMAALFGFWRGESVIRALPGVLP